MDGMRVRGVKVLSKAGVGGWGKKKVLLSLFLYF